MLVTKQRDTDWLCPPALSSSWFREALWQLPGVMMWPSFFGVCKRTAGETQGWSKSSAPNRDVCGTVTGKCQWPWQGQRCLDTGVTKPRRGGVRYYRHKSVSSCTPQHCFSRGGTNQRCGESTALPTMLPFPSFLLCIHLSSTWQPGHGRSL